MLGNGRVLLAFSGKPNFSYRTAAGAVWLIANGKRRVPPPGSAEDDVEGAGQSPRLGFGRGPQWNDQPGAG